MRTLTTPDTNPCLLALSDLARGADELTVADVLRSARTAAATGRDYLAGELAHLAESMLSTPGAPRW